MAKRNGSFPESVQPGIPSLSQTPEGWLRAPLNRFLREIKRPVTMTDDDEYKLVTVKRSRGGVEERSIMRGRDIKVKSQFFVKADDFLISRRQIVHGACAIVPQDLHGAIVSNEYAVLGVKKEFDLEFLKYLSNTMYFQQTCFHSSIGVHVEKMIFKLNRWLKWDFNIPPYPEQKKMVQILSAWDKAIETVDKLIENRQKEKKWLMQNLLTGKKRLSGFSGEWKKTTLEMVAETYSGGTPSRDTPCYYGGDIPWIKSGEVNNRYITDTEETITQAGLSSSSAKMIKKGDVLVALYGATAGVVGMSKIDAAINQAILCVAPYNNLNNVFLMYYLDMCMENTKRLVQGGQPNLNAGIIRAVEMYLPDKFEQEEISKCISCCENAQHNYMQQRDNLITMKSALMQQLLTGKRRVKVNKTHSPAVAG